jgi:hypothetical protein
MTDDLSDRLIQTNSQSLEKSWLSQKMYGSLPAGCLKMQTQGLEKYRFFQKMTAGWQPAVLPAMPSD